MHTAFKVLAFLAVNIIGSWMGAALFYVLLLVGFVDLEADPVFAHWFLLNVMFTWMVCAVFSISFFFLSGWWKYFFLAAPVVIPILTGMALPFLY